MTKSCHVSYWYLHRVQVQAEGEGKGQRASSSPQTCMTPLITMQTASKPNLPPSQQEKGKRSSRSLLAGKRNLCDGLREDLVVISPFSLNYARNPSHSQSKCRDIDEIFLLASPHCFAHLFLTYCTPLIRALPSSVPSGVSDQARSSQIWLLVPVLLIIIVSADLNTSVDHSFQH